MHHPETGWLVVGWNMHGHVPPAPDTELKQPDQVIKFGHELKATSVVV